MPEIYVARTDEENLLEISRQPVLDRQELRFKAEQGVLGVQLEYVKRIYQQGGYNLEKLLEEYTILDSFITEQTQSSRASADEIRKIKIKLFDDINGVPITQDDWATRVVNLAHDANVCLRELSPQKEPIKVRDRLGIFEYEIIEAGPEVPEKYAMTNGATCLELHFPEKFIDKAAGKPKASLNASLAEVASFIIKQHPEIQAIVGKSWLMAHPLATSLGFEKTAVAPADQATLRNPAYWTQLIDEHGKIKQDVAKFLYEHNRLPYDLTTGRIDTVQFLKRYLPLDQRGVVTLKEISPEYEIKLESIKGEIENFSLRWPDIKSEEVAAMFAESAPECTLLIRAQGNFDEFTALLEQFKNENRRWDNAVKHGKMVDVMAPVKKYLISQKYIEKPVTID